MLKKLDLYTGKFFIKYFFMSIFSFTLLFLLAQMFKIIKYINQGKLVGYTIFEYIINLVPKIFIDVAPLSVLLAGLILSSTMASNLEIVSLKTSGIKFSRIFLTPIIISFFISILVFFINNTIYTNSLIKINLLRGKEIEKNVKLPVEKENAFYRNINENYLYFIKKINRETGLAEMLEIVKFKDNISNPTEIITAKNAKFDFEKKVWVLNDVNIYNPNNKKNKFYPSYTDNIYNDEPDNFIKLGGLDPRMQTIKNLKKIIKEQKNIGEDTKVYLVELAKRYSYPFASFVVVFIGLSIASRYVRGSKSSLNLLVCIVVGYSYYLFSGAFEAMSINGIINPFIGSWIPNIFYIIIGIFFMRKAEY